MLSFALVLASLYGALCLLARVGFRALVYPAPTEDPAIDPTNAAPLTVVASDGVTVRGLALAVAPGSPTIVLFHGNGEVIGDDLWIGEQMVQRGFGVVLVEYRGYGRSSREGSPTEAGLYADGEAVIDELARRGIGDANLLLWGQSMGSGVAAEMARRGHGSKLLLVAPYTSIPDVAATLVPWLPVHLLVTDRYATLEKAPALALPTFVLHGTADQVVPFAMGERVSRALPRCTFVPVAGGRHGDLFLRGGRLCSIGSRRFFAADPALFESALAGAIRPGAFAGSIRAMKTFGRALRREEIAELARETKD